MEGWMDGWMDGRQLLQLLSPVSSVRSTLYPLNGCGHGAI
jgi:hypothetical protein